jgi:pimeloyl-ACP methyl ester carboxylesterase
VTPVALAGMRLPVWRESTVGLEAAALAADPVFRGAGVPRGDGRPVLLVPGLLAGDVSLARLAGWLRRMGYDAHTSGLVVNADCTEATSAKLAARADALAGARDRRVALIGHSRGGQLSRALAHRRPDLVSGVVTLGSPLERPATVHPVVVGALTAADALAALGVPGLARRSCINGDCCRQFRRDVDGPLADDVGLVTVYTRRDGIVDWRTCLDPQGEAVEVPGSHVGMAVSRHVYRAIAAALPTFDAERS